MSNSETVARLRRSFAGEVGGADVGAAAERLISAISVACEPELECVMAAGAIETEYRGVEGLREGWVDFLQAFERMRVDFGEMAELGDAVLDEVTITGIPKETAVEISQPAAAVWWFRDGRVRRLEFHIDRAAARRSAEAGLGAQS